MLLTCTLTAEPGNLFLTFIWTNRAYSLTTVLNRKVAALTEFRNYFAIQIVNEVCEIIRFISYFPCEIIGIIYCQGENCLGIGLHDWN